MLFFRCAVAGPDPDVIREKTRRVVRRRRDRTMQVPIPGTAPTRGLAQIHAIRIHWKRRQRLEAGTVELDVATAESLTLFVRGGSHFERYRSTFNVSF